MEIKDVIVCEEIAYNFVEENESNELRDSLTTLVYVCTGQDD